MIAESCSDGKGTLRRAEIGRALASCARFCQRRNRDGRLRQDHSGDLFTLHKWGTFYFALTPLFANTVRQLGPQGRKAAISESAACRAVTTKWRSCVTLISGLSHQFGLPWLMIKGPLILASFK